MDTNVQAEPVTGTVPVAALLDLVRKHADRNGWCEDVERYLRRLGLEFEYSGCSCSDFCMAKAKEQGLAARFTLVQGAPETVGKAALLSLIADLVTEYSETSLDIVSEAVGLFGLELPR